MEMRGRERRARVGKHVPPKGRGLPRAEHFFMRGGLAWERLQLEEANFIAFKMLQREEKEC